MKKKLILATSLPLKYYFTFIPIYYIVFFGYIFISNFEISFSFMLVALLITLDVILYPWVRIFFYKNHFINKIFPVRGFKNYMKYIYYGSKQVYSDTENRTKEFYNIDTGNVYHTTKYNIKGAESIFFILKEVFIFPFLRFYFFSIAFIFSFVFGWFLIYKRVY